MPTVLGFALRHIYRKSSGVHPPEFTRSPGPVLSVDCTPTRSGSALGHCVESLPIGGRAQRFASVRSRRGPKQLKKGSPFQLALSLVYLPLLVCCCARATPTKGVATPLQGTSFALCFGKKGIPCSFCPIRASHFPFSWQSRPAPHPRPQAGAQLITVDPFRRKRTPTFEPVDRALDAHISMPRPYLCTRRSESSSFHLRSTRRHPL